MVLSSGFVFSFVFKMITGALSLSHSQNGWARFCLEYKAPTQYLGGIIQLHTILLSLRFRFSNHLRWMSGSNVKAAKAKHTQKRPDCKEIEDYDIKILKRKESLQQSIKNIFFLFVYQSEENWLLQDQQRKLFHPTLAHRGGGPSCVILRANRNSASCPWQMNWDVWVMSVQTAGEIITLAGRDPADRAAAAGRVIPLCYFLFAAPFL